MNHHDEAIQQAPSLDLPKSQERAAWLGWVNYWYPYDKAQERAVGSRMPADKPAPQSPEELQDMAGISDREMAWYLARAWFVIRDREQRRRAVATRMPTQQTQQARNDLFGALDERYDSDWSAET